MCLYAFSGHASHLYECPESHRLFVVNKGDETAVTELENLVTRHREASAKLTLGNTSASESVPIVVLARPRPLDQRVFWDMSAFYALLRMNCYSGQASKWIFSRQPAWTRAFEQVFGSCQIVFSVQYHEKMSRRA